MIFGLVAEETARDIEVSTNKEEEIKTKNTKAVQFARTLQSPHAMALIPSRIT